MTERPKSGQLRDPLAPWERFVGHAGYVAEALVYVLIGGFGVLAALRIQPQPNGSRGALTRLSSAPFGKALLVLLALGLAAFVLWQLLLAFRDPEHQGDRAPRRLIVQIGHILNGVLHSVLVGQALWILFGLATRDDEKQSQVTWTARAMALPGGRAAVAMVGIGIMLFALWQLYRAFSDDKNKRVDLSRSRFRIAISALGVYGLTARGVLFGVVGLYLLNAAWHREPRYSSGIAGALSALKQQPYGEWLLGIVSIGLVSYGFYQIIKERYRRLVGDAHGTSRAAR
ncbi:MAG TPA: DUF1206 domain-containing protein [Steroidobacteraceae bacterium]